MTADQTDDTSGSVPQEQAEGSAEDGLAPLTLEPGSAAASADGPYLDDGEGAAEKNMEMPENAEDACAAPVYRTELEQAELTIDRWQDEGFTATVTAGDSSGIFQRGDTVLAVFEAGTEVLLPDGGMFFYDQASPNASDCGLAEGETVTISFTGYELEPSPRIYALRVEPANQN